MPESETVALAREYAMQCGVPWGDVSVRKKERSLPGMPYTEIVFALSRSILSAVLL